MRIVESNLALAAQSQFQREQSESLKITIEPAHLEPLPAAVEISSAARILEEQENIVNNDPRLRLIKQLVESMIGGEIQLRYIDTEHAKSDPEPDTPAMQVIEGGVRVEYRSHEAETEQLQFSASGTIRTADGRSISFSSELALSRSFSQTTTLDIASGSLARPRKDPLVINYAAASATLSDQTFRFDLDADGDPETVHRLNTGSAYLALDLNHDGKINHGKELFGTQSGNGFADLQQYDDDRNGWIDSGDAIFGQLKLWLNDESESGQLKSLTEMKIGALYLADARADFALNNAQNQNYGLLRSTGLYLSDEGNTGTMQQLDLSI
ncbi:hypothetical protein [Chitinibacter sp. S2-10]|uniref:hypothetical protein n=1 Tax=Chitinibacter sp. S2-10 TaxID=3373597 RepID=UPI0039774EEA